MAKITRVTSTVFANGASGTDIEQFGSKVQTGTPNYTNDPAVIQSLAAWSTGWSAALVVANNSEYKQDRNAVDYVAFYQLSYLLQQGIPEWDSGTTYYINSVVQNSGNFFISLTDTNLGNTPPATGSNSNWHSLSTQPTRTVLTSGSGTYTPPTRCIGILVQMIGGGGGGAATGAGGAGGDTTFSTFTAGGGGGGLTTSTGGAGGTASGGSVNISGQGGGATSGDGGSSFFGGAGSIFAHAAAANSGSGGGSSGTGTTGGGGAGGYIEVSVSAPTAVSYGVGAAGAAGSGGAGAGGSGLIIITEYYS